MKSRIALASAVLMALLALALAPLGGTAALDTVEHYTVAGNDPDPTDTRVLAAGEVVTLTATGTIYTGCGARPGCGVVTPEGESADGGLTRNANWGSYDAQAATTHNAAGVTSCPVFSLLYRLGTTSGWSCAGGGPITITGTGTMLQVWMFDDYYADNSGSWDVALTSPPPAPVNEGCVYSHGYFKNKGKNLVTGLTLGGVPHTAAQVKAALDAGGGKAVAVKRHLIAFLLTPGPHGPVYDGLVYEAQALLAGGPGDASALASVMEQYITTHHC
jgi:hypothetical protein